MCVLQDFDVVFAPLISSYGSATATLEHSPGTDVAVFATYLTPALQQRMHETEGAYSLVALRGVSLREGLSLQQHRWVDQGPGRQCGARQGVWPAQGVCPP